MLALLMLAAAVSAETFVSFKGQFHIAYPPTWYRVDYQTADFHLSHGDPNRMVDFEVVLHERAATTIFQGQYLVLTVDTTGAFDADQIDSVVSVTEQEFGRPRQEVEWDAFMVASDTGFVYYDAADSLVAIESLVQGDATGTRTNLLVMRFYERGIANFYFYAPTREIEDALPTFREIVASFSTQNMQEALKAATEPVEVADIDKNNGTGIASYILIIAGLALILIVILIVRKKTGSKQA